MPQPTGRSHHLSPSAASDRPRSSAVPASSLHPPGLTEASPGDPCCSLGQYGGHIRPLAPNEEQPPDHIWQPAPHRAPSWRPAQHPSPAYVPTRPHPALGEGLRPPRGLQKRHQCSSSQRIAISDTKRKMESHITLTCGAISGTLEAVSVLLKSFQLLLQLHDLRGKAAILLGDLVNRSTRSRPTSDIYQRNKWNQARLLGYHHTRPRGLLPLPDR